MKYFSRFSTLTTLLTYILIFVGGLVRVSGAGMGCPDWPKCFGRWIPPTSLDQLPTDNDPAQFNIVLAWIEYSNRLVGVVIGLMITATLILAYKYYKNEKKVLIPIFISFIMVGLVGWQGSQDVGTVLNPLTLSLHMVLALFAITFLIIGTQNAYYLAYPVEEKDSYYPCKMKYGFLAMGISLFLEIILGTELRAGLEMVRKDNPLVESVLLLKMLGPFKYIHTVLGVILAGVSWWIWYHFTQKSENASMTTQRASLAIMGLVLIQIVVGELMVFSSVNPIYQLFHMWSATWVLGLLIVEYGAWKRSGDLN